MGLAHKASFILIACSMLITGCTLTQKKPVAEVKTENNQVASQGKPNPKPRPKSEPNYPPASTVIVNAAQCGGYKASTSKLNFVGENELKSFFKSICLLSATEPEKALAQLEKSDHAYYWPDDIKQYSLVAKATFTAKLSSKTSKASAK